MVSDFYVFRAVLLILHAWHVAGVFRIYFLFELNISKNLLTTFQNLR